MINGAIKSQIDQIWNAFWSGGISNPIEVIEQITYLLFLRRLDDLHTLEENKSARLGEPISPLITPCCMSEIFTHGISPPNNEELPRDGVPPAVTVQSSPSDQPSFTEHSPKFVHPTLNLLLQLRQHGWRISQLTKCSLAPLDRLFASLQHRAFRGEL